MTTQTRVLPDLDEALDFEPTCQRYPCDQVAEWLGWTDPCQCIALYMCGRCKRHINLIEGEFECPTCRRCQEPCETTWRPL